MPAPGPTSLAQYGGALANYQGIGIVDPTTDTDASAFNQLKTDVAMMSLTVPVVRVLLTGTGAGGTPTLTLHSAQWGAIPAVAPVVARTSAGVYTLTWATTYLDQLGVSRPVALQYLDAPHVRFAATALAARAAITAANVITLYTLAADLVTATDIQTGTLVDVSAR